VDPCRQRLLQRQIKPSIKNAMNRKEEKNSFVTNNKFAKQKRITSIVAAAMALVVSLIGFQINNLAGQYKKLYSYEMNEGLNRHPYYTDAYDEAVRFRKMNSVAMLYASHLASKQRLMDERDMSAGMLLTFQKGTDLYEKGKRFESLKIAIDSSEHYLASIDDFISGKISPVEFFAMGDAAGMNWYVFAQDCVKDEGSIRDRMQREILAFKPLAEESLYTFLTYFAVFLAMVYAVISISWKLLTTQRKSYERVDLLISSIGHDLRSPLQAIENSVSLMGSSSNSSERLRHAKVIKGSANTVARLVDDILTVVRHQKPKVKNSSTPITDWLNEFETVYKPKVIAKGLTWVKEFDESQAAEVMIDPERLRQCIGNLVDNSVRYTDTGFIEMKVRLLPTDDALKRNLIISVTDSGIGIAEKDQKRIFKPFERAAREKDLKGMGLGLSIVETIVESFNGKVSMESERGRGSKFTVSLAVDTKASGTSPAKNTPITDQVTASIATDAHKLKESHELTKEGEILVIDDTKDILDSVTSLLKDVSFDVDCAPSGIIAVQMLERAKYKIVLTDLQMPGVDGVGVAKRVRELGHKSQLIVMTADSAALTSAGDDVHFDFILPKPFQAEDLLAVIERAEKAARLP
jgi:signal transduction histidine kinase/CheY-like chemotaxis protein